MIKSGVTANEESHLVTFFSLRIQDAKYGSVSVLYISPCT